MKFLKKPILLVIILSLISPPGVLNAARISGDTRSPAASEQADTGNAVSVKADETPKKKSSSKTDRNAGSKKSKKESTAKSSRKSPEAKYVTIDFDNVDIPVFVKFMSEVTGKNFVIDNNVKGKVTIYSPKQISLAEAYKVFESVLECMDLTPSPSGDVIRSFQPRMPRRKALKRVLAGEAANLRTR